MKAMLITKVGFDVTDLAKTKTKILNSLSLLFTDVPAPKPEENEVLLKVTACGVCHTDLDEIEGRAAPPVYPVIPGHQVIGKVIETGRKVTKLKYGDRVGAGWFFSSCGKCSYCVAGNENLCKDFKATGRDVNGGYAEYMTVSEDSAFVIPDIFTDTEAAPLLCAGAVGYRSVKLANIKNGHNVGLTGFGAAGHLSLKTIKHKYPDSKIFVFARSGKEREFAKELGAYWCGNTEETPPEKLNCIIDTTPAWTPVAEALKNLEPGGRLVINAIRKENKDINVLSMIDYHNYLWMEKEIKSVANVTPSDIREFLELAAEIPIKPEIQIYKLEEANIALTELKLGKIRGAKVLVI
jgi:propanol-preferring alcohol dehydrogenase